MFHVLPDWVVPVPALTMLHSVTEGPLTPPFSANELKTRPTPGSALGAGPSGPGPGYDYGNGCFRGPDLYCEVRGPRLKQVEVQLGANWAPSQLARE